jgi:hypothetical protein
MIPVSTPHIPSLRVAVINMMYPFTVVCLDLKVLIHCVSSLGNLGIWQVGQDSGLAVKKNTFTNQQDPSVDHPRYHRLFTAVRTLRRRKFFSSHFKQLKSLISFLLHFFVRAWRTTNSIEGTCRYTCSHSCESRWPIARSLLIHPWSKCL